MRCSFCPARRASFTNRSGRATSRFSSAIAPTPRSSSSPSASVEWRSARSSSGATANDCIVLLYGMQSSRQRSACSDCCFIRRSAPSRQLRTTQYSRHSSPHPAPSLLSNGCSPPVSFSPSRFCWAPRFLSSAPASCGDGNSVQVLCCHGSTRPTHLALRSACCWQDSTSSAVSIFQARLLSPPLSTLPPQPSRSLSPVGAKSHSLHRWSRLPKLLRVRRLHYQRGVGRDGCCSVLRSAPPSPPLLTRSRGSACCRSCSAALRTPSSSCSPRSYSASRSAPSRLVHAPIVGVIRCVRWRWFNAPWARSLSPPFPYTSRHSHGSRR